MAPRARDKYRLPLSRYLNLCSQNYHRLLKVMYAAMGPNGESKKGVRWCSDILPEMEINLSVIEQTPYTDLIQIEVNLSKHPLVSHPRLKVRLYHDAAVAEVLSSQQISSLLPAYDYPNDKMLHRDEKFQVNLFLAELLEPWSQMERNPNPNPNRGEG